MNHSFDLNATHDPAQRSWVESANAAGTDFPLQNLPFAVFKRAGEDDLPRGGVAIGDQVLDLRAAADAHAWQGMAARALRAAGAPTLNELMRLGPDHWHALRAALFDALRSDSAQRGRLAPCLVPQSQARFDVPAQIGDFTDFYASIHHATAVGRLFRPDNPLLPNYTWVPIGYHGRSSSIGVSGQQFHRPRGQRLAPGATVPVLEPSARMDYELELGIFIGAGNEAGRPVPMADAESQIFGLCLLNDWSARDIQAWEYQPLGPFLAKNFATTISPWVVTAEALAPYRQPHVRRDADPAPLPYLDAPGNRERGAIDIRIEAWISTAAMRARGAAPQRLSSSSFKHSSWTAAQLVAHHTVNGCNLRPGDLLGTGTQSGPQPGEAGSLLELSAGGKQPIAVGEAETRTFVEDGDDIILRGWCEAPGRVRIGFGEAAARLLPAL
jgi:fumarylacetoacetase